MYIGHYAVAFGAKGLAPQTSLGVLLGAALFVDLLWPLFLIAGWEHVRIAPGDTAFTPLAFVDYPITHSLVISVAWALAAGLVYLAVSRYPRGSVVVSALVLSHWFLDLIVHRPDLPLYPGDQRRFGFALWNSVAGTLVVESVLFAAGLSLYLSVTRPLDSAGRYGLLLFVLVNIVIYLSNVFGPPPPDETALAWVALAAWLFPLWAWRIDRHRTAG
jgi:hypothetical protein